MPTPFSEIFERFLADKEDDVLNSMTQEDLDRKLFLYMERAITLKIKQDKKVLTDYSFTNKTFNIELNAEEMNLIVLGMTVCYKEEQLERQMKLQSRLGISISNRDYKISPNSPTLKELDQKIDKLNKEIEQAVTMYSYNEFAGYK